MNDVSGISLVPEFKDYSDIFGKTEVRRSYNTEYIVHTKSYNGNTISTIQVHPIEEARLTQVRQSTGGIL